MVYHNTEQKAHRMWKYCEDNSETLEDAIIAFNNVAPAIKANTIEQLYVLIDGELI